MSECEHTSDEFGKPIPTTTGLSPSEPEFAVLNAPTLIELQGIDEERRDREGHAPSPFTIATWKIVVFLLVMFLLGVAGYLVLHFTGMTHRGMSL